MGIHIDEEFVIFLNINILENFYFLVQIAKKVIITPTAIIGPKTYIAVAFIAPLQKLFVVLIPFLTLAFRSNPSAIANDTQIGTKAICSVA